jgi:hypothetical protein
MVQTILLAYSLMAQAEPVAVISLYNPTAWAAPLLVEVPAGSIAAPGLLDWRTARLQAGQQAIPFDIREGRAHWRTHFLPVRENPHAEDLLVFSCAVPPGQWLRVQVFEGASPVPENGEHLHRENGKCAITYPGMKAAVDEGSGRLLELIREGGSLLTAPMSIDTLKLTDENPYTFSGGFAAGYADPADPNAPRITLGKSEPGAG